MAVQNQHRHHPQHWNNNGRSIEAFPYKQYHVLVDGSRRTLPRNRSFFKISINLNNSLLDLNKAHDVNDPLTPVVPLPDSPHPVHLEHGDPPSINDPPTLTVPPQPSVSNKFLHHLMVTKPNYRPNLRTKLISARR